MAEDIQSNEEELQGWDKAREVARLRAENFGKGLPPEGTQGELLDRSVGRSPKAQRLIEAARERLVQIDDARANKELPYQKAQEQAKRDRAGEVKPPPPWPPAA